MRKILLMLIIIFGINSAWADEQNASPVKTIMKIQGGTELAYNIDYATFGITNFLREIGFWMEIASSDDGFPQTEPDSTAENLQLAVKVKGFKFALKTSTNTTVPSTVGTITSSTTEYGADIDGIEALLFWRGFWFGILGSPYYTTPLFNYAQTNSDNIQPAYNAEAILFANAGLFQPNSSAWDNNPDKYGPQATYYTLKVAGDGYDGIPLTGTTLGVGEYAASSMTKGALWCGYSMQSLSVDFKIGAQNGGFNLLSNDTTNINTKRAFNFMGTVFTKPMDNLYIKVSGIGGFGYDDNPFGAGTLVSYAMPFSETIYLVPVLGLDFSGKWDYSIHDFAYLYEGTFGLKFLWGGNTASGNNPMNSASTLRGVSVVGIYGNKNDLQLQLALYEPAMKAGLIPNVGITAFAEIKNILVDTAIDSGKNLWGVGGQVEYYFSAIALRPYIYGHYKVNTTLANAGQFVVRGGVRYEKIKRLVIDFYYAVAHLKTESTNIGNIALDLNFNY